MGKSSRKILAIILAVGILATLVAVPMAVSAVPAGETYAEYDEVTYDDLKLDGNSLNTQHTLSGGITFTYDATSPSYSAILKYRFIAGSKPGVQFSFDEGASGNIAYPFGVWIKRPNSDGAGENGAWHLKPDTLSMVNMSTPLVQGTAYDIELGRLKVLTGENNGKYYVYLKVNDELIQEGYSAVDENGYYTSGSKTDCQLSNKIRFGCWGNGAEDKMTASPVPETYEDYDVVTYYDLLQSGSPVTATRLTMSGDPKFGYNRTSSTYSVIFKYRWIAGADPHYVFYFDSWSGNSYPFCLAVKRPGFSGLGAAAGENGAWHLDPSKNSHIVQMTEPIVAGNNYDIEHARLKVATGPNAGKYYVYVKVNGELIYDYYYDGDNGNGTYGSGNQAYDSNYLRFTSASSDNYLTAIPEPETYEDYDEVYYSDLMVNGNPVANERSGSGTTYTYNKTSASGSAVLKLRYIPNGTATEGQISFDRRGSNDAINYMFGVQIYKPSTEYPDGRIWLRPGYGPSVAFNEPIVAGESYDIEFARLKVATGLNAGKYYMYFKMNDVLLAENYVAANVVDGSGNYTSDPSSTACSISNEIYITFWGGGGATITNPAYTETYEDYDEIGFNDLYIGDISMAGRTMSDGNHTYTYNRTSPTYSTKFKYRWTAGGDVMKFTTYFDDWVFPFCFAAKTPNQSDFGATAGPNGAWHLVPSNSSLIVNMDTPIVSGRAYDIEVGRLKVKTGPNKGKYYVYFMVDDGLIKSYYYDGVNNGTYGSNTALSNKIIIASPAGNKFSATPAAGDIDGNGVVNVTDLTMLRDILLEIEANPGSVADFNKDTYIDIRDLVAMKKYIIV